MALTCAVGCRAALGPLVAVQHPSASAAASAAAPAPTAFKGHGLSVTCKPPPLRCCSAMPAPSVSCAASHPDSTDATIPDPTPTVLEFQPSSNMPVMPPEWKEREEKRKAEEALLNTPDIQYQAPPSNRTANS